jgi:hypothetical protein
MKVLKPAVSGSTPQNFSKLAKMQVTMICKQKWVSVKAHHQGTMWASHLLQLHAVHQRLVADVLGAFDPRIIGGHALQLGEGGPHRRGDDLRLQHQRVNSIYHGV